MPNPSRPSLTPIAWRLEKRGSYMDPAEGIKGLRDQKKASKVNPEAIRSVAVELHSEKATVRRRRGLDLYGPPGTVSLHSTNGGGGPE